jgi:glycosyl transferase family 25
LKTAIYVVSLVQSSDRRGAFERHYLAAQTDIPWEFFDAHTTMASCLEYDERDAIIAKGRALYPRELACYSSHYSAWARFLNTDAEQLLVVEDDVVLDWGFVKMLRDDDLTARGISYLKLFSKNITPFKLIPGNFFGRSLIDCRGFAHGMQAYVLTKSGAKRFLDVCRTVRRPIDDEMDRSWAHGIANLAVFPFPAFERVGPSTIGTARYEKHALPIRLKFERNRTRLLEKLRRIRQRITGFGYVNSVRSEI